MLFVRHAVFSRLPSPDLPFLDNPLVGADFWTARLTAIGVVWRYVGLLVWPRRLSWDYSYDQISLATLPVGLAALGGVLGVVAILVWAYRRHPRVCFFGAFFFLALAPVSNVLFLIGSIMAERFLYLPSLGFSGFVVALAAAAWTSPTRARLRPAMVALLALAVGALGVRTWHRNLDWTDGERLWASATEASPKSYKTHLAVVYGMSRRGFKLENIDLAIREARTAAAIIEKLPPLQSSASALTTLGTLYRMKGDLLVYRDPAAVGGWYRRALETLSAALPIDRAYAAERRRRELARGWPQERISARGFGALYENLAETYGRLGRPSDAADALRHRIELAPLDPVFHAQLAGLEEEMGRPVEAILSLWMADIVGGTPDLDSRLVGAYRRLDPAGCATGPSATTPNRDCPLVRTHLCSAELRLVALLTNTGRPREAERRRLEAVRDRGCSPP
jgi:tetratricopeptide (TPR) repeat protein